MGSNFVGHNTQEMRNWSNDIVNAAEEYDTLIKTLYSLVDGFVSSDFTGGLSGQFEASVMNQREHLNKLTSVLQEVSECVSQRSNIIDQDEEELKSMMNNSSLF